MAALDVNVNTAVLLIESLVRKTEFVSAVVGEDIYVMGRKLTRHLPLLASAAICQGEVKDRDGRGTLRHQVSTM